MGEALTFATALEARRASSKRPNSATAVRLRRLSKFLIACAVIVSVIGCTATSPEGFPSYSLPRANGPGNVGGGGILLSDGSSYRFYNLATDSDLGPARDDVRARLLAQRWTVGVDGAAEIGTQWFTAMSPHGDVCLRYIQMEASEVKKATQDPVLSQISILGWKDMLGPYHNLIFITSGACSGLRGVILTPASQ
jgi:hypothetical protein